jgi:hypothetical protein
VIRRQTLTLQLSHGPAAVVNCESKSERKTEVQYRVRAQLKMKTDLPDTIEELHDSFQTARSDIAKSHLRCKPSSIGFTWAVMMLAKVDRIRGHAENALDNMSDLT